MAISKVLPAFTFGPLNTADQCEKDRARLDNYQDALIRVTIIEAERLIAQLQLALKDRTMFDPENTFQETELKIRHLIYPEFKEVSRLRTHLMEHLILNGVRTPR